MTGHKQNFSASYVDIMEKNHMEIPWHDYANAALPLGLIFASILTDHSFRYCT